MDDVLLVNVEDLIIFLDKYNIIMVDVLLVNIEDLVIVIPGAFRSSTGHPWHDQWYTFSRMIHMYILYQFFFYKCLLHNLIYYFIFSCIQ